MKFPLKISSVNVTKSAGTADLVTFTEEILNGKLQFLCSALKRANHGKSSELNHGCVKPGFTTVNYYSIDRPINFVLKAACL